MANTTKRSTRGSETLSGIFFILLITSFLWVPMLFNFMGGGSSHDASASASKPATSASASASQDWKKYSDGYTSKGAAAASAYKLPSQAAPTYADPRWPTTSATLTAIPESERWYNAGQYIGTTCTLAGPVNTVHHAAGSNGSPWFVDIGGAYPDCVTLVVWEDSYGDFAQMISEVSGGKAWLSVTGYLSVYNGRPQFNVDDGPVSFTWWTNVS